MKTNTPNQLIHILTATAILACAASAAFAQPRDRGGSPLDLNHDGAVTEEEALIFGEEKVGEMQERLFARYDANEDGVITEEEYSAVHEELVARWVEHVLSRIDGNPGEPEDADARRPRPRRGPRPDEDRPVLDVNEDGQITQQEVLAVAEQRLTEMADRLLTRFDVNEDGVITEDEALSVHEQIVAEHIAQILEGGNAGEADRRRGPHPRKGPEPRDGRPYGHGPHR